MKDMMTKTEILNRILEEQQKVINNLQTSIDRYKSASSRDNDNSIDPEDYSHQDEAKDMKIRLEEILKKEQRDKEIVESCLTIENKMIERGALAETESFYIFIGMSVPIFSINGKQVLTISEMAPIYSSLKDKTKGDKITIGKKTEELIYVK